MKTKSRVGRWVLTVLAAFAASAPWAAAQEAVTVVSKLKDLKLRVYGFVETDLINDSTQGLSEEAGNNLIPMRTALGGGADNYAGIHHRTQMSVRNSRIGFDLSLPKTDQGLDTQAIVELDFLGNNGTNATPGSAPGAQTERDFFNNPAVRVRHAYLNLTYNDWNAKVGQTWSLLGWQPYFFPGETIVQPAVGQLYRRFAQMRLTHTCHLGDAWFTEEAVDAAKPAEMNSGVPEFHGGVRLASTKTKAASIGGSGTSMVPLSVGASAALIPVRTMIGNATGEAVAVDAAVPLLPSSDGKDRANNLILMGEFMNGRGVGGLEYSGLTLGVPGVTAATAGTAVDSGIAGFTNVAKTSMELIRYRVFRTHLQYSLAKWSVSGGYAQVEGTNLNRFSTTAAIANAIAPKIQFGYVSVFYDPLAWVRLAGEWNHTVDTYNDAANRHAINNRLQFTTFFLF